MSMAIEVCSEISISPRISFSHDLNQNDGAEHHHHPKRLDTSLLDSTWDFDFGVGNCSNFVQELPSADELFSNGKILPIEIKKKHVVSSHMSHQAVPPATCNYHQQKPTENISNGKKRLKEFLSMSIEADEDEKPAASKSFWQFKRSSSLNCESKSLIRSSLHFLSRSNSTGSAPNPKPTMLSRETQNQNKQHLQKQPSLSRKSSVSSTSSSASFYSYNYKPPLKKSSGDGVRVSPVLNLSHPFISNATVSFFGFAGSLFCNGKLKKKKR